jgi:N-carbamoyl-L-amino-acid hydrolase
VTGASKPAGETPARDELRVIAERAFAEIAAASRGKIGVSRASYGDGETRAREIVERIAAEQGLAVTRDGAANLVIGLDRDEPGAGAGDEPAIFVGSHLDSVPQGGNYDGLAGVLAGLLCLIDLKRSGRRTSVPIKAIALRGEESAWFGVNYVGAKALLGKLTGDDLRAKHRDTGSPLGQYMEAAGADMVSIEAGKPLFDIARMAAFFELHIEQGPVMVARDLPVAAVTGVRGNVRHRMIRCVGEAGHSGAVPRWLRRDAVFATADLIMRLDDHWTTILQHGGDLVLTTGIFATNEEDHAMSRIPGEVGFSFEARSQYVQTLDALLALMHSECATLEDERRVKFEFDNVIKSAPAILDKEITARIAAACEAEGLPSETLPSGAGHDASMFANAGVPTGMIFVRNQHGSHNPDEDMDMDDFMKGVAVLSRTVAGMSS